MHVASHLALLLQPAPINCCNSCSPSAAASPLHHPAPCRSARCCWRLATPTFQTQQPSWRSCLTAMMTRRSRRSRCRSLSCRPAVGMLQGRRLCLPGLLSLVPRCLVACGACAPQRVHYPCLHCCLKPIRYCLTNLLDCDQARMPSLVDALHSVPQTQLSFGLDCSCSTPSCS